MSKKSRPVGPPSDMSIKTSPIFITKVDAPQGIIEAIVSVFGVIDYGRDVIHPGAFTKTIVEHAKSIRVVDQHRTASIFDVIGRPLEMREVNRNELPTEVLAKYPEATGGLLTITKYLLNTPEGRGAFERLSDGAINEYSFGYEPLDVDYGEVEVNGKKVRVRNIRTIKLWEYSPVIWGMNPATATTNVKEMTSNGPLRRVGDYLHAHMIATFNSCGTWLYADGFLSEDEWKKINALMMEHLDAFRNDLPEEIALLPITYWLETYYDLDSLTPEMREKVGRILSNANVTRLKEALSTLQSILEDAGVYDQTNDEDEKQLPPSLEQGDGLTQPGSQGEEPAGPTEASGLQSPTAEAQQKLVARAALLDRRIQLLGGV